MCFINGSKNNCIFNILRIAVPKKLEEKGFDFVEKFVLNLWKDLLEFSKITLIDAKTKLQEYSLKKFKILPIYKLINTSGPKHKPIFKIRKVFHCKSLTLIEKLCIILMLLGNAGKVRNDKMK